MKLFLHILLTATIVISFSSCRDDGPCPSYIGEIVSYDMAYCMCCGGYLVEHGDKTLRFYNLPDQDELEKWIKRYGFPIEIAFNYKDGTEACADHYKIMTCMEMLEHNECEFSGQIIDYNYTECLCCPGWLIVTGQDTIKVAQLPIEEEVWHVVTEKGFPLDIRFSYSESKGDCSDFYKEISCIEFAELEKAKLLLKKNVIFLPEFDNSI